MKISTKGRYGLRILLDLALHEGKAPRLIRDIAESQQISEKYISRLIIPLRKAGMVRSIRGAKGGFLLAKNPADLTYLNIIEVMEGPVSVVNCIRTPRKCAKSEDCAVREIWNEVNNGFRASLTTVTLQTLIEKCHAKKLDPLDYCI